jgi:hypothetical protein
MKKIRVVITSSIFICLILFVSSCKKANTDIASTTTSQYYMRFKGNGAQKEFTATTAYYFTTTCSLNGGTNDSTGNAFTINIVSVNVPIQVNNTFTETQAVPAPNSYTPKAYFAYGINSPSFYNYGSWIAEPSEHSVYACVVKILELDATHVKGTFSGKVRERNGSSFINITDGEFNVKRIF